MENTKTTEASVTLQQDFNPFGDDNAPQVQNKVEEAPILNNEPQSAPPPQEETKVEEPSSAQAFDSNQFVKERFGFESVEQAEEEFKRFKEPKEEFKFQDDMSKTLFDAIKEGKTDDIYEILNQQKKLL